MIPDKKFRLDKDQIGAITRAFHQRGIPLGGAKYKFGEMLMLGSGEHIWYFAYQPLTGKKYDGFYDPFIIEYTISMESCQLMSANMPSGQTILSLDYIHQVMDHYFNLGLR